MGPFPTAERTCAVSVPEVLSESLNWYQYANDEERTLILNGSSISISGGVGVVETYN